MKQVRTKEEYIEAANNSYSIAGMLRVLGLKPCGGNYKILHKAIETYGERAKVKPENYSTGYFLTNKEGYSYVRGFWYEKNCK